MSSDKAVSWQRPPMNSAQKTASVWFCHSMVSRENPEP